MIDFNLIPVLPEIFLSLIGMGLLIVGVTQGNVSTRVLCWASAAGLAVSGLILLSVGWDTRSVLNGMFIMDKFAGFMKLLIIIGLIASLALSVRYLLQEGIERFEFPILVLLAGVGMMMMVSANNLLALYMGLELQSLALYVLAAFHRNSMRSSEAGIKYFLLGALSSGMLLFGMSLIYGFTGSVDFEVIGKTLGGLDRIPFGVTFGLVFMLAGLAFKVSAVPFHMWTPDVYQGAPTAVTALFAIVPKVAAMGLLMRLLFEPFMAAQDQWVQIIYFLSLMSMFLGAFAGIAQDNIKRLLAYSSIGNMGYALIGVVAGTAVGAGSVVLYLFIYMIMTAGVFAVVMCMRRQGLAVYKISDLAGLSHHAPGLAYAMAILMFSMSGIPPAAGFFGKLAVFNAAVAQEYYVLATLGVLTSVVAAYYYLRVIKVMFFDEPVDAFDGPQPFARRMVLFVSILFVLGFAIKPSVFVASSMNAASVLFAG
ncbi:MAG: NADH-quinone oxidoreductase subunit NuoN [Rhodospirillales bacterium]|nr:NADH-quinone oxidoreductase subunit NuoN [Rhodospirillales bacterium]